MKINDKIDAGIYFGVHKWSGLKHAAMRLAMENIRACGKNVNEQFIHKIANRWTLGDAISFYSSHQDLWFNL